MYSEYSRNYWEYTRNTGVKKAVIDFLLLAHSHE